MWFQYANLCFLVSRLLTWSWNWFTITPSKRQGERKHQCILCASLLGTCYIRDGTYIYRIVLNHSRIFADELFIFVFFIFSIKGEQTVCTLQISVASLWGDVPLISPIHHILFSYWLNATSKSTITLQCSEIQLLSSNDLINNKFTKNARHPSILHKRQIPLILSRLLASFLCICRDWDVSKRREVYEIRSMCHWKRL